MFISCSNIKIHHSKYRPESLFFAYAGLFSLWICAQDYYFREDSRIPGLIIGNPYLFPFFNPTSTSLFYIQLFRHWCNSQMQRLPLLQRMLWMEEAYLGNNYITCLTMFIVQLQQIIWWCRCGGAYFLRWVNSQLFDCCTITF